MDNEKFNTYCSLIFIELVFTSSKFVKQLGEKYKELNDIITKLQPHLQQRTKSIYRNYLNTMKNH